MDLAGSTSPQAADGGLVLVPVGSLEQHGPHLPLDTDTVIATAVATAAAEILGAWCAPAITYGASGEHQAFAGTVSIGSEALEHTLIELVRSLRTWADRVLFVNAHGGNLTALEAAVTRLRDEGHDVAWVPCRTENVDLHAGRTETSLLLHLQPWSVRLHLVEAGNTQPLSEIWKSMVAGGVIAVSANGVLGDPAGASAEDGRTLLDAMIDDVVVAAGARV